MIRRSAFVALCAILMSLLAHLLGLSVTAPSLTSRPVQESSPDTVDLGNAFEDFAEAALEPVQPEPTEPPTPPVEPPTEPENVEIPTSDARVASPDPQQTFAPDTGTSTIVQPEAPDETIVDPVDQDEGTAGESVQAEDTPPVEPVIVTEAPARTPDATASPVEPSSVETPVADAQQPLAALPTSVDQDVPPDTQPVVPVATPNPALEDADLPAAEAETDESEQAVVSSLRPRLPDRSAQPAPPDVLDTSKNFDNLRFPEQTVESPLATYRREGLDAFRQSRGGNRSGGRGPGNSDTTNYAGQVLVHLNRAPLVYVATRGFAQVFFEINPDGTLAWVDVIDSSGAPDVERAAKEQVKIAAPFPPPPGGVSRKLSFFYQIR